MDTPPLRCDECAGSITVNSNGWEVCAGCGLTSEPWSAIETAPDVESRVQFRPRMDRNAGYRAMIDHARLVFERLTTTK